MAVLCCGLLLLAGLLHAWSKRRQAAQRAAYWERIRKCEEVHRKRVYSQAEKENVPSTVTLRKHRPQGSFYCPRCGTIQPAGRTSCCGYRCGTRFVFQDGEEET